MCSAKRRGPPLHSAATELSIGAGTLPRRSGQRGRSRGWTRTETVVADARAVPNPFAAAGRRRGRRRSTALREMPVSARRPHPSLLSSQSAQSFLATLPAYLSDPRCAFFGPPSPSRLADLVAIRRRARVFCPWPLRAASGACDYAFESQVPEVARGRLVHWASILRESGATGGGTTTRRPADVRPVSRATAYVEGGPGNKEPWPPQATQLPVRSERPRQHRRTSEERRPLPAVSCVLRYSALRFSRRIDRGQAVSGSP